MNENSTKDEQRTKYHIDDLTILKSYLTQEDPVPAIIWRTFLLGLSGCSLYLFLALVIPENKAFWFQFVTWAYPDLSAFTEQVNKYLAVDKSIYLNRLMLIVYLSLYAAMWWVYFQSKIPTQNERPPALKPLEVQTLRRLLGFSSVYWDNRPASNKELVDTYRKKGSAGMQVLAILIAVSLLIFDEIGDLWSSGRAMSLWQFAILWAGMLSAAIAFIGFVLCVDSFDSMFNRFKTENVRNLLVNYFYKYTINPRYIATANLLLSLLLLLAFYSEVLAAIAIAGIVTFGFGFWFPDIRDNSIQAFHTPPPNKRPRSYRILALLLITTPVLWQLVIASWSSDA